jgi:hypothetical protein
MGPIGFVVIPGWLVPKGVLSALGIGAVPMGMGALPDIGGISTIGLLVANGFGWSCPNQFKKPEAGMIAGSTCGWLTPGVSGKMRGSPKLTTGIPNLAIGARFTTA